jgi:hypothetical protein
MPFAEVWDGLVHDVYEAKTGKVLPQPAPKGPIDPAGVQIDVNDSAAVAASFPRPAALARPEPAPSTCTPPVGAVPQLYPRCHAAMTAITMGSMLRDPNGEWEHAPREFRRCDACRGIAWRWEGAADWRPAPDDPMHTTCSTP